MFNEYWKAKAAKRRKAWAAVAKRFADEHAQLEKIRKKVFTPLDYNNTFSFEDYKVAHLVEQNPIAEWEQMKFRFSESGLREAMAAEGADLSNLAMKVSKKSIVGVEAPCPQNRWDTHHYITAKIYDNERAHHAWLKKVYAICTDMETVRITYGGITMTIKRYSKEGMPFGYYELNPCEQLTKAAMMMQETDFNMLNVATLLMEMDAEWELRQEEMNYYAKQLRLRTMEAAVTDDTIDFTLWDDKKLEQKIPEYVTKDYPLDKIINQVLRPWKAAVSKCFERATERTLNEEVQKMATFSSSDQQNVNRFVEQILCPYLQEEGLHDVIVKTHGSKITLTYQGCQCSMRAKYGIGIVFCPNTHYEEISITLRASTTPMSIIGAYLKQMPTLNNRVDDCLVKVINLYHRQLLKNEEYSNAVQHLNLLIAEHAGKPVARLLKYMLWNIEPLISRESRFHLSIPSIKVIGDTSFSYIQKNVYMEWNTPAQDVLRERWVDAEGRTVYAADPLTTDAEKWKEEHKGLRPFIEKWSMPLKDFVEHYSPGSATIISSSDFVEEKL